jgi:hypothetical protein
VARRIPPLLPAYFFLNYGNKIVGWGFVHPALSKGATAQYAAIVLWLTGGGMAEQKTLSGLYTAWLW